MEKRNYLLLGIVVILFLLSSAKVYASTPIAYLKQGEIPSIAGFSEPAPNGDADCASTPASLVCSEGASAGTTTCTGETACVGASATWTKYNRAGCFLDDNTGIPTWVYDYSSVVCSTGDKCVSGETGLRSGQCDCGYSSSDYKYCCDSTGTPEACIQSGTQDTSYPPEGQCPGGYIVDGSRVRDSSCVPITITPTPSPSPGVCQWGSCAPPNATQCWGATTFQQTCQSTTSGWCWSAPSACSQSGYACTGGQCLPTAPPTCINGQTRTVCTSNSC